MPENTADSVTVQIVREFYRALNDRDTAAVETLIERHFASSAAVEFPPSLPYGGRFEGVATLGKLFHAMASGRSPVGPREVSVIDIVGNGDTVIATLAFDWYPAKSETPVPSGACETWAFSDGQVTEIRAYYWDTAALVAAST